MKKSNIKLIIASGIALASITAALTAAYKYAENVLSMAMDRNFTPKKKKKESQEKGVEKISGEKPSELLNDKIAEGVKKLEAAELSSVTITAGDGAKLNGRIYVPSSPKRMIIAMHGWRSSWTIDFGNISEFWHENDCIVLYPDQRAHAESEGEYISFGLLERYDCLDWVNWAKAYLEDSFHDENIPIYLHGVSMGGTTVLMTAGFDLPKQVHGIIADCGFTSPHYIWKHVAENNMGISYSLQRNLINHLCKKKISVTAEEYSTLEAMKSCRIPVLFIHGTDDKFVPIGMTFENYDACTAPKKIFTVEGAGHGASYFKDTEGYQKAVREFWEENDRT